MKETQGYPLVRQAAWVEWPPRRQTQSNPSRFDDLIPDRWNNIIDSATRRRAPIHDHSRLTPASIRARPHPTTFRNIHSTRCASRQRPNLAFFYLLRPTSALSPPAAPCATCAHPLLRQQHPLHGRAPLLNSAFHHPFHRQPSEPGPRHSDSIVLLHIPRSTHSRKYHGNLDWPGIL